MSRRPAIFASAFHPHVGGVEELVRQLATEQRRLGMDPLVVTNRHPSSLPSRETVGSVPVARFDFRAPSSRPRQLASWAALSPRNHAAVIRELRRHGTDLIHVQCVSSNASYALSASRALRLPLVVTMQGELSMDANRIYERSLWLRRVWRRTLDRADVITACSQYVLDEAEEVYGRAFGDRGQVIPNGVRLAEYPTKPVREREPPYVFALGRMVPQKGFDLLIDAFAAITPEHPALRLKIAGDGILRADLMRQAQALGIDDRVDFLGSVSHNDVIPIMCQARAFVLPSRHEPQGIVILEAMAARTRVVAAAVGGVPEMARDGVNATLFHGGDGRSLAVALAAAVGPGEHFSDMIATARATAEAHDWHSISAAYSNAYARIDSSSRG